MDAAKNPGVKVCWNCNPGDLSGKGLKYNFGLVKSRLGETVHIHDLRGKKYPWEKLFALLKQAKYEGWTLVEEGKRPDDLLAAMKENRKLWNKLVGKNG